MWVQNRDYSRSERFLFRSPTDNVFSYDDPIKGKQKEMNLDVEVDGIALTEVFRECLDNFEPIVAFLRDNGRG